MNTHPLPHKNCLFAGVFSIVSCAVLLQSSLDVHALLTRSGGVVERPVVVGSRRVPTCMEAGVCGKDRQRVLIKKEGNGSLLAQLKRYGCSERHETNRETSLSCPVWMRVPHARAERAFRSEDLLADRQIHADDVWAQGVTGANVPVAVLDTGVDAAHEDLAGRIVIAQDFTESSTRDMLGHGTHVAGIVAGKGARDLSGNRSTGAATGAVLLAGKVCSDEGWCLEGDIVAGIEWAVGAGARVINLSLGGGAFGGHCDGDPLAAAVNRAADQGVTVVVAAGNNGAGVGTPACASKAVAVGAVDSADVRPTWSSVGTALDVMAPGVSILSAYSCDAAGNCPGTWHARMSGTSMAAPHVAGVAALLIERHPHITQEQIRDIIAHSAADLGDIGYDMYHGHGRIDALAAVHMADELLTPKDPCPDADGDGITLCGGDCRDDHPLISPVAPELCNGVDDDCDGRMDNDCRFAGFCGDARCMENENHHTCPQDCLRNDRSKGIVGVCGNAICEGGENVHVCPADCTQNPTQGAIDASGGRAGGNGNGGSGGGSNAGGNGNGRGSANGGGNGGGNGRDR